MTTDPYTPDEAELIGCYAGAMEEQAGENYDKAKADAERGIEAIKAKARAEAFNDARHLWMVWWNRNTPNFLHLKAKHHAEGQRAFQRLLAEARSELRTDEAVERVARAIHDDECACGDLNNDRYGDDGTLYYLDKARIAITALLGDD